MVRRRCFFTLIELFLTLTLIALIGSFFIVQTKPLLDHHHFMLEVGQLKQEIAFSRKIALTANTDVELYFYPQRKEGIKLMRTCKDNLNLPGTFLSPHYLSHLKLVGETKERRVLFTSSGTVESGFDLIVQYGKWEESIVIDGATAL